MRFERDLKLDLTGDDVRALHTELVLLELYVPHVERHQARFRSGTQEVVCKFQRQNRLEPVGVVDSTTVTTIGKAVDETSFSVMGTGRSPDRAGVGGLKVQIVDKNLGKDIPLVEAMTDQNGYYQAQVSVIVLAARRETPPDLQALAYSGTTPFASSQIRYNASYNETLGVALPASFGALPSEYESLTTALAEQHSGPLGDLVESTERKDITYLATKTGWDARLIAMTALALYQDRVGSGLAVATDMTRKSKEAPS